MSFLTGATNVVVKGSQLINQVSDGSKEAGLRALLKASIPGASHDSSERYPPPICHPGTRKDYIGWLTQWALNTENHTDHIAWMKGPAGVGKSAVAQSCAEALGNKLGASFFFSRANHRDDPGRFFTSIAYQLTEKYTSYGAFLDDEIRRRPTLINKALPHQFRDLFVVPFAHAMVREEVGERVIIVDGLDECASREAQVDIIKIIAESVRAGTTPFLWIFLSRLEPKIVTTFDLPDIRPVSQQIDLPVSREIDQEILLYLADKLQEIGRELDLTLPWPSEREVWALVDFSAGLFACAHAIIHFVGADHPAGPMDQLNAVLQLAKRSATRTGDHPLSALDELYTLIMEQVPPAMLQTVQWILLTTRMPIMYYAYESANLVGLSELQLRSVCRCLHSVISVVGKSGRAKIAFYHSSFMDYSEDPSRSGRFCIWSDCAVTLLEEVLRHLDRIQITVDSHSSNYGYAPRFDLTWPHNHATQWRCYQNHVEAFFRILHSVHLNNGAKKLHALMDFDFKKLCLAPKLLTITLGAEGLETLRRNLDLQLRLLRPHRRRNWWAFFLPRDYQYTIGHGDKKILLNVVIRSYTRTLSIRPYSPRLFKKWIRQFYEESKQPKEAPST